MDEVLVDNLYGDCKIYLDPAFFIEKWILEKGSWEPHVINYINSFLKPGQTCIDVGANAGYHTLLLAKIVGQAGKVLAFEPNEVTYQRLLRNLELNPQLAKVTRCYKNALGDCASTLKVYQAGQPGNAYVSESFKKELWNRGTENDFIECEVLVLDDILRGEPIHFLKIDVEGMELDVIRGARKSIEQHQPVIVYETLTDCFDLEKIKQTELLLREMGYELCGLDPQQGQLFRVTFPNYQADTVAIPKQHFKGGS